MEIIIHPTYFPSIAHFVAAVHAKKIIFEVNDTFIKQTYRSRTHIYGTHGILALNVPIVHSKKKHQRYRDVKIFNASTWQSVHWKSLLSAYQSSPFFEYYEDVLRPLFCKKATYLLDFNMACFDVLCSCLQLDLNVSESEIYQRTPDLATDFRGLVKAKKGIPQAFDPYIQVFCDRHGFISNLSILDLLFNEGPQALQYLISQSLCLQ